MFICIFYRGLRSNAHWGDASEGVSSGVDSYDGGSSSDDAVVFHSHFLFSFFFLPPMCYFSLCFLPRCDAALFFFSVHWKSQEEEGVR